MDLFPVFKSPYAHTLLLKKYPLRSYPFLLSAVPSVPPYGCEHCLSAYTISCNLVDVYVSRCWQPILAYRGISSLAVSFSITHWGESNVGRCVKKKKNDEWHVKWVSELRQNSNPQGHIQLSLSLSRISEIPPLILYISSTNHNLHTLSHTYIQIKQQTNKTYIQIANITR